MKLYGSPTSPYVRKARVLAHEKQLPLEFVIEDPWAEDSPIVAKNPLSKVPVLEIAPGQHYFESALVVHFLDHVDGRSLTPPMPRDTGRRNGGRRSATASSMLRSSGSSRRAAARIPAAGKDEARGAARRARDRACRKRPSRADLSSSAAVSASPIS